MKDQIIKFWRDEEGATAIEYALIAGLMAVGLVAALGALTGGLATFFTDLSDFIITKVPS
ncbi:Flp family type IVb pilin [Comamonas thiooxydans]|uniref:Flp family type IVb pilin n=1 Tax=Comamonas thiooxydans TaxID=363952 RepID=A0AA42TVV8_9BURK|nr:Flp family type IVb pilin [Comamonas thiooxydans]MDH1335733.1 Flp family type IVb pilin [Comamonas thiooxydans]MDH1741873.1 Flp family type IVb pilin [Comamonas thiooxydans]MDH1788335.1 Flp family type IVb pilin [Comamonas thiooxydans]